MIIEALEAARRADTHRGDEHLPHCADLYGCDRATYYRRSGYEKAEFDAAKLRKFDIGNAVEQRVISQLREQGHVVETGMTVKLVDELIGHPDAVVDGVLLEIKTTDGRKISDIVSPHYELQAAAYAIALGLDRAIVHVTHVANYGKDEVEYPIDVEWMRDRVMTRAREVIAFTDPRSALPAPMPAIESREWMCKYCDYRSQCELDGGPMPGAK